MFDGKAIVVTGGAGSIGSALVKHLLTHTKARQIRVFDNDEYQLFRLGRLLDSDKIRLCLGDIRSYDRFKEACSKADIIIHLAALKNMELTEHNPSDTILTNVTGTQNVVRVAKYEEVDMLVNISTDKVVNPTSLYGATKLIGEKLVNHLADTTTIKAFNIRPCNVVETRGNIYDVISQVKVVPITDLNMTRYWIHMSDFMDVCMRLLAIGESGRTYIPKGVLKTLNEIIPEGMAVKQIPIRVGEKIHEELWTEEESRYISDCGEYYQLNADKK